MTTHWRPPTDRVRRANADRLAGHRPEQHVLPGLKQSIVSLDRPVAAWPHPAMTAQFPFLPSDPTLCRVRLERVPVQYTPQFQTEWSRHKRYRQGAESPVVRLVQIRQERLTASLLLQCSLYRARLSIACTLGCSNIRGTLQSGMQPPTDQSAKRKCIRSSRLPIPARAL